MKNSLKIINPCPENWENMQGSHDGRFCEKCSKCVIDFTYKTDQQIQDIFKTANGKEICGRISSKSLSMVAAGIILVTHLSFAQAQTKNDFTTSTEQKVIGITKVSGRLIFKETQKVIPNADVFFITKSKFLKSTTNENGYFSLDILDDLIEEENILYFNFDKLNEERKKERNIGKDTISGYNYGDQTIIFSKNEKIENKRFQIDYKGYEIGAVVIVNDPPPDYYYFNGKSISERKFERLKKENPGYQYFFFEGKEADIISQDSFIDKLYLLYSN